MTRVYCPNCSWYGNQEYLKSHYCLPPLTTNTIMSNNYEPSYTVPSTIPCPPPSEDSEADLTLEEATIEQLIDELKDRGAKTVTLVF